MLHRLAAALYDAELDLTHAKVATLGHEVVDVFYVRTGDPDGTDRPRSPRRTTPSCATRLIEALTPRPSPSDRPADALLVRVGLRAGGTPGTHA